MNKIRTLLINSFIIFIIFALNTLSADEKVLFDSDEKVQEVLLSHSWDCNWKDTKYSWRGTRTYEVVSLKKITAKIKNDICPTGFAEFNGYIDGSNLNGAFFNYPAPCGDGTIHSSEVIFKKPNGNYYTKASYSYDLHGAKIKGETICNPILDIADKQVMLDSNQKAQKILLGHTWNCRWKDNFNTWTGELTFQKAKLKKVTAKIMNIACPSKHSKFAGNVTKGMIAGLFSDYPKPCGEGKMLSHINVFEKSGVSYSLKGTYEFEFGSTGMSALAENQAEAKKAHGEINCDGFPK